MGIGIEEVDGLRLVCDDAREERPDLVQGVTAAAETLSRLIVRRPVRRALDLGTGCGFLALTMAAHAERVVGTDVNPRAVELARESARRSGIGNAEFRQGDWFEPVAGERFDLLACNPPYVVSPETRFVYRDGSDATPGVVRAAAGYLTPGGLAHFLVNFAHEPDDWVAPLRAWIPPGCDALAVHHSSLRPHQYAETWAEPERRDEWVRWYAEQGIAAIGAAFLLLRRREDDGPPRLQALEATERPTPRAGVHVERILEGTDLAADEERLLAARLAIVDGVRAASTARRRDGRWVQGDVRLTTVPTVGVEASVPGDHAPLLSDLDGTRPLGEVAEGPRLETARRLVELGYAAPSGGG